MIKRIYKYFEKVPGLSRFLKRFRQGLPASWLFSRSVVGWTSDDSLIQQLPMLYRFLGIYCGVFFKLMPTAAYLSGGRYLLKIILILRGMWVKNGYQNVVIGKYISCIDFTDPRFLQVVNELKGSTDTKIMSLFLEEGDTFVDVGANQGAFSIVASHLVGKNGQVVSIEPQARLARAIELSLAESPVWQYKVYQVAVGDYNGEISLIVPLSYTGAAGIYKQFSGTNGYWEYKVPIRRFDDVVNWKNFRGKVFIKLDIEGAELAFLKGASRMIKTIRPNILMEINSAAIRASGYSIYDLRMLLDLLGYSTYSELENISESIPIGDLSLLSSSRNILIRGSNKAYNESQNVNRFAQMRDSEERI
jgi:FkbM family methyltransferase